MKQEVFSRNEVMHCQNERFVTFDEELAGGRERGTKRGSASSLHR